MKYGWPTSRTFPRTEQEAFRDDPRNAEWWHPPEQRWQDKAFFWLAVAIWIAIGIYFWKFK